MDVLTGFMNGVLLYVALPSRSAESMQPRRRELRSCASGSRTASLLTQSVVALAVGDLGVYGILPPAAHAAMAGGAFTPSITRRRNWTGWLDSAFSTRSICSCFASRRSARWSRSTLTPAAVAVFVAVSGWQASLVHANVRCADGPLRWLVVSPEFHHWHHSAEREALDRNYASLVASWDVLFRNRLSPARTPPASATASRSACPRDGLDASASIPSKGARRRDFTAVAVARPERLKAERAERIQARHEQIGAGPDLSRTSAAQPFACPAAHAESSCGSTARRSGRCRRRSDPCCR